MSRPMELACLAMLAAVSMARADIAPTPDRGPPMGSAGGLNFAIQSVEVEFGPVGGPHYQKSEQVVVLVGCIDGHPNCALARSKTLIGMEVSAVDGEYLVTEKGGMVQQIVDAFAHRGATPTIMLELYSRASHGSPIKVAFARR